MATLSNDTITVEFPDAMEWVDEFDFSPVSQDVQRTIGGSFIIQEAGLLFGRPITLQGGEQVWLLRSVWRQLVSLADVVGAKYVLTLADGSTYNVIFRRDGRTSPATADPLWRRNVQTNDDYVKNMVLQFYTVSEDS